ncbi:MAG: septal ring lytic transglycosylase RlpA family protein [Alphaproteobacteria bacterium]|jgi:rare lipoprotein A|nr:septal ring lytic transglycosylase RlpA family protein [Alphaproteobacteria bacterium]
MRKIISIVALPLALAACGQKMGGGHMGDFNPQLAHETLGGSFASQPAPYLLAAGPNFHIGAPFRVENVQYNPAEDMNYNEVGIAGIIPLEMNGVRTTNGELFNSNQMLATSKVLPLPSIVRVTNLENGASAVLRVNNRGPFVNSRIMDVSPAAARVLRMTGQTRVQVQILPEESTQVRNATLGITDAAPAAAMAAPASAAGGPFAVQVGAFFAEDSARSLAQRIGYIGHVTIVPEDGMFKVRIAGLDASAARNAIDTLRRNENMSPGLLENGRWVNADSI